MTPVIVLASCLLAALLSPGIVRAADDPTPDQLSKLVKLLGDDSFRTRERAYRELLSVGLPARNALTRGLRSPDLEIRVRARRLLSQVLEDEFEGRLAAFIADVQGTKEHDLPGWKRYRDSVGTRRMARTLYVSMIREEIPLLQALDSGRQLDQLFAERVKGLQPYSYGNGPRTAPAASLATLLFLCTQPELSIELTTHQQIFSLLQYTGTMNTIKGSPYRALFYGMLDGWVRKLDTDLPNAYYPLMTTLNYDMKKTGYDLAKKHLAAPTTSSSIQQYAIMAIARFGSDKDIDLLTPHLQNSTVCHTWNNPQIKKGVIRTQVRDVALVMMLELTGQNQQEYGFTLLKRNTTTVFHGYTCGFVDESNRDKALQMWKTWYSKRRESE